MSKVPDRTKLVFVIYLLISYWIAVGVRKLFDVGLVDRLVVHKGPLVGLGLIDLLVVLCAVFGGIKAYYAVYRLRRDRKDEFVFLEACLATLCLCAGIIGPMIDSDRNSHAIVGFIAGFLGFLISLNINIRFLQKEESNGKYWQRS